MAAVARKMMSSRRILIEIDEEWLGKMMLTAIDMLCCIGSDTLFTSMRFRGSGAKNSLFVPAYKVQSHRICHHCRLYQRIR